MNVLCGNFWPSLPLTIAGPAKTTETIISKYVKVIDQINQL